MAKRLWFVRTRRIVTQYGITDLRDRLAAALVELRRLRRESNKLRLLKIRNVVDDACEEAFRTQRYTMRGAINWGDLGCADVGTKDEGYYAVIEEADPAAWELCRFVADRLAAAGFDNVDVSTEW